MSSYVALTRVRRREDMLIFRPFDREPYTQKERKGPGLLLQSLRGDSMDWDAIEKEFMPAGKCALCSSVKYKNQYALGQWSRDDGLRVCKLCLEGKKSIGTPWQCMECFLWKGQDAFHASQHHSSKLTSRRCVDCPERRKCYVCEKRKYEEAFAEYQWERAGNLRCKGGMCAECDELKRKLECARCGEPKLPREFRRVDWGNEDRLCEQCRKSDKDEAKRLAEEGKKLWCDGCKSEKCKQEFSGYMQTKVASKERRCSSCVLEEADGRVSAARTSRKDAKLCSVCERVKSQGDFSARMWRGVGDAERKCTRCIAEETDGRATAARASRKDAKWCSVCERVKSQSDFSVRMWRGVGDTKRKCTSCLSANGAKRGHWTCIGCKKQLPKAEFSFWMSGRAVQKPTHTQRCNTCYANEREGEKRIAEANVAAQRKARRET